MEYEKLKSQMRVGDAIFFNGAALISKLIHLFSHGYSHVVVVKSSADERDVLVTESTLDLKDNGVWSRPLKYVLAEYKGKSSAYWYPLLDSTRKTLNEQKFQDYIIACTGKVHYDVDGLLMYAEHELLPFTPIPKENPHSMFCSAYATALYQVGEVLPKSLDYRNMSPLTLSRSEIYGDPVRIL